MLHSPPISVRWKERWRHRIDSANKDWQNTCVRFSYVGIALALDQKSLFYELWGVRNAQGNIGSSAIFIWKIANQAEINFIPHGISHEWLVHVFNPIKISSNNDPLPISSYELCGWSRGRGKIGACDIFTRKSQIKFIPHWFLYFFNPINVSSKIVQLPISAIFGRCWQFCIFSDPAAVLHVCDILRIFILTEILSKMPSRPIFCRFLFQPRIRRKCHLDPHFAGFWCVAFLWAKALFS